MDYATISKDTIDNLYSGYANLQNSSLSKELLVFLELRVSQINGCKYCCNLHKMQGIKLGIAIDKINALEQFINSNDYNAAEKEALSWAERLTKFDDIVRVTDTKLHLYFK
jgi:AhpD family alkylhydroperoxidase